MACHTRSGVAGISSLLLPIASVMALMTAAEAPIAPASPQPLTPSGLPGHSVVVCDSLNDGRSSARGMVSSMNDAVRQIVRGIGSEGDHRQRDRLVGAGDLELAVLDDDVVFGRLELMGRDL